MILKKQFLLIIFFLVIGSYSVYANDPKQEDIVNTEKADTNATKRLDELVVTKSIFKHEGNKDIITITESMKKGTKNAGELLGRLPGVYYNPITTDLVYQGLGKVIILVDSVEKDPSYIKNLSPKRFDKITIINNPTGIYAQYDAVINLHARPLYSGYEGLVLGEAVLVPDGNNGKGKALKNTRGAGQFTYTRDRFNLDIMADYRFLQQAQDYYFENQYPLNGIIESSLPKDDKEPNRLNRANTLSASIAADYEINKQHSLSAIFSFKPSSTWNLSEYNLERIDIKEGSVQRIIKSETDATHGRMDLGGGLWYRGVVGSWNINADASYTGIAYRKVRTIDISSGYILDDARKVSVHYGSVRASAGRYIGPKWYLSISDSFMASAYNESRPSTGNELSSNNDFRNTFETSLAWYNSQKFYLNLTAGLNIYKNNYNTLHSMDISPSGGVQAMWAPTSKAIFRFDYRISSQTPALTCLQDYGQFTDSLIYTQGNPQLKPSLLHNLTLAGTFLNRLSARASYSRLAKAIFYMYMPAEGMLASGEYSPYTIYKPFNGTNDYWNVNLTYTDKFGPHWIISASANISGTKAILGSVSKNRVLPSASWYIMYQSLGNTLQIYLSGSLVQLMNIFPQTDFRGLSDNYGIGVSKTFFKNRLETVLLWTTPIHFVSGRYHGATESKSYIVRYDYNNQFRSNNNIRISLVYRFQNGKSVRKYNRQSESRNI